MPESPTKRRYRLIYQIGCICCRAMGHDSVPCQVHHLNTGEHAGQKRLGNDHTIGLCPWHHQGIADDAGARTLTHGPSLKWQPATFRYVFGSDARLLAYQNQLISRRERLTVGR